MFRPLLLLVMLCLTTFAIACGGSTTGTGGVKFSGIVQDESGKALSDVVVSVNGEPATALTAADGSFEVYAEESAAYEITFVAGASTASVTITDVPAETKEVTGIYTIKSGSATAEPSDVTYTSHTESADNSAPPTHQSTPQPTPTPAPTAVPNAPILPGPTATATVAPTQVEHETEDSAEQGTSTPEATPDNEHNSGHDDPAATPPQPTSTPEPTESESGSRVETGRITALSATSLVVNSVTFIINHETEWKDLQDEDTTSAAFSVGDTVRVKGEYSDGTLVAHEVRKR